MAKNFTEHARVTAICVNLALDAVEADIRSELELASPEAARTLKRLLKQQKERRVSHTWISSGSPLLM